MSFRLLFSTLALLGAGVNASAQTMQWNEETCRQVMLGFKDAAEVSEKVLELRAKTKAGDKTQETEDTLVFYRDIEWYCLER